MFFSLKNFSICKNPFYCHSVYHLNDTLALHKPYGDPETM
jgi:hypothetical protein